MTHHGLTKETASMEWGRNVELDRRGFATRTHNREHAWWGGGGGAADLEHTELELEKHIPWRTAQTSSVHSAGKRERPYSTTTTAITGDTCSLNVRWKPTKHFTTWTIMVNKTRKKVSVDVRERLGLSGERIWQFSSKTQAMQDRSKSWKKSISNAWTDATFVSVVTYAWKWSRPRTASCDVTDLGPKTLNLKPTGSRPTSWASRATCSSCFLDHHCQKSKTMEERIPVALIALGKKILSRSWKPGPFCNWSKDIFGQTQRKKKKRNAVEKSCAPVRIELTTFRLWDWRAAYCAKEASARLTHVRGNFDVGRCCRDHSMHFSYSVSF